MLAAKSSSAASVYMGGQCITRLHAVQQEHRKHPLGGKHTPHPDGLALPTGTVYIHSMNTDASLTARQNEILEFIRHALSTRGVPPTREEIARAFGFRSLNASEQHLQALQRKGLIELLAGTSRGIRLKGGTQDGIGAAAREFGLPLIGKVAAGSPILAQENVLKHPVVDAALFKPRADYLLEVRGMSMRDAGILDGDWLAVHRQQQAMNGQIVVARLIDEVTVKRFRLKGTRVELIAENPDYAPIVVDLKREALAIEGLVVGVIRASL